MKLQLKRSNVLDGGKAKEPTPPYVEYGELCVNYNVNDPALFIKDSNDNIIRIAGKNSVGSGSNPSGPNNPGTGNNIGDVFFNTGDLILYYWDGNQWVPIASQEHAADIYVGTFAEVDVEIPVAERRNGLLLWETEEGNLFLWYIDADTAQWVVAVPGGGSGGGAGSSSNVTVLDVAPNNPEQGDLWYCTLDGRLYIYYQDINTSQWVDASPDNLAEGFWERDGTTLKPVVAGDDVDLGTGDLSAAAGMFSSDVQIGADPNTSTAVGGIKAYAGGAMDLFRASTSRRSSMLTLLSLVGTGDSKQKVFSVDVDGEVRVGGDIDASPNITLNANGSAIFGNQIVLSNAGTATFNRPSASKFLVNQQVPFNGVSTLLANGIYDGSDNLRFAISPNGTVTLGAALHNSAPSITLGSDGEYRSIAPAGKFSLTTSNTTTSWQFGTQQVSTAFFVVNSGGVGVVLDNNATAWTARNSDSKLKTAITDADEQQCWEVIRDIQLKNYQYKDREVQAVPYFGPMADWLQEQDPDLGMEIDGELTYNAGLLEMKALQALSTALTRIEALEAANASLEARLTALEGGN